MKNSVYNTNEIEEVLSCPWCGSKDNTAWSNEYDNFPPVKCNNCGVVFLKKRLNEVGRKKFYDQYVQIHETPERLAARLKMYEMEFVNIDKIVLGGKVLDVGCGSGKFLSCFPKTRYKRYGVEYGREAVMEAQKLVGEGVVYEGALHDVGFIEKEFDLIIFRGVVEHLPNPRQTLDKACSIIKKGGFIFLTSMPNLDCVCSDLYRTKWTQHREYEHIVHFSKNHFRKYFEDLGFREVFDKELYWETPYANPQKDIFEVAEALKLKAAGQSLTGKVSPPFWGNVLSLVFRKDI